MNRKSKITVPLPLTVTPPGGPEAGLKLVLKIPEFCIRYQISRSTAGRWLSRGMPHIKTSPRSLRIPTLDADRWVKENFYRQREPQ